MLRILRSPFFGYRVVKSSNGLQGQPLPNMDIYYLTDASGKQLSFWNDIPFRLEGDTVTCCIEVPKEISNKYEVIKEMKFHPIMQDTKKNVFSKQLERRYYAMFPLFNYGFIPQTWEQNITPDQLGLYVPSLSSRATMTPSTSATSAGRNEKLGPSSRPKCWEASA
jgi:hypothetical protein